MEEDDAHSYVSLFGQRVSLPVETIGDEGNIPSLKHLSLKETLCEDTLSGLNSHPTIRSLPTEVLMIIFKYLSGSNPKHLPAEHFAHQRKRTRSNGMESAPIQCDCKYTWLRPAVHWRLFPHSQARVCTRWRAILSSSPTIWTRVVVSRVSGDWTHPHELEEYLRWTKGHPIEVYIGNERNQRAELNGFGPNTVSERDMVAQYTALLRPHLWRCTVIDYHVQYSTSLPSLIHDLTGISEHLESLRLVCDEECPASYKPTKTLPPINAQIRALLARSYPKLIALAIDGANFILACLYLPELLRAAQDELTIHHYHNDLKVHPHVDNEHFSVHNILAALYPRSYPSLHPHRLLITFRSVEFHHLNGLRYILKNSCGMYKASPPQLADDYGVDWRHIWLKFVNIAG
ncbi:hypothetical protein BJ165DRAFT_418764 [Panaeolus papilionaceus]|nr:hypothetical protein BJ165DRAFT_418764 [Panaeolus papilionaceus]